MFRSSLLLLFNIFVVIQAAKKDFYKGAVVEFAPHRNDVLRNVDEFMQFIHQASEQEVDIIVFPEIGLNGYGPCYEDMFTLVPDPSEKVVVCQNGNFSSAMQAISCSAKESSIYVVANLAEVVLCSSKNCSADGRIRYNTNVVFDRSGAVIARYRKFHLFGEPETSTTPTPELVYFDTDFGVRFGTFICFDMMFEAPATQLIKKLQIENIVYSTAWFSELPFLTALQAQSMWSYAMDVNFLASGYNAPEVGSGGSGIYLGKAGPVVTTFPETTTSKMLIAQIPINRKFRQMSVSKTPKKNSNLRESYNNLYLKSDYLNYFTSSLLKDMKPNSSLCNNNLCCNFHINYTAPEDSKISHRAVVFDGVRTFDGFATGGTQLCAIISCINETVSGCGIRTNSDNTINELRISGTFENNASLQMPSTLRQTNQLEPLNSDEFSFQAECNPLNCYVEMKTRKALDGINTFGIYSRNFRRDGEPVTTAGIDTGFSKSSFIVL